jgi:hypothetical protein
MGDKRDDDSGESREQDRIMRGYKLGDVSHDMWKRKFLDVAVRFGMEVLLELETETLWAYEEDEPLEEDEVEVSVRNRTTQIISKTFKVWDEARDREPLQKRWKVWNAKMEFYERKKLQLWPTIMSTLTTTVYSEVSAHKTFGDLRRMGNTLGLWLLLQEITRGLSQNNSSELKAMWEAMRYVAGTSITDFMLEFMSLIEQIDMATDSNGAKMSNSTKCYQLTKAFSGQTYAFVLGDALSMLKNDPKYPDFDETVQKLKNQVLNTTGSNSWVTVGKKGKAMRLGEDQKPGAGWGDKKRKKVEGKEDFDCYRCGKGKHYARDCRGTGTTPCSKCGSDMHMTKYHKDRKPRQEPYKKRDYDGKSKKRDTGAKTEERAYQLASKQKKKRVEYDTSDADTSESEGSVRSTKGQAGDYLASAMKKPAYKKQRVRMMTNRGGTIGHPTVTSVLVPGRVYYKCWMEETSEVCILTAMETYKRINKVQILGNKTGYTYSWEQRGTNPAIRRQIMEAVPVVEDTGECVMLTAVRAGERGLALEEIILREKIRSYLALDDAAAPHLDDLSINSDLPDVGAAIREAILHFGDDSDVDQGVDGASVSSAVAPPEAEAEAVYDGMDVEDAIDVDMESVDVSEGTDEGEEISTLGMDARQGNREACREYLERNIDCVSRQKTLNIVKNLMRRDKADTATFRRRMTGMMRRAVLTSDRNAENLTFVVDKEVNRRVEVRLRELQVKNSPVPAFLRVGRLCQQEVHSGQAKLDRLRTENFRHHPDYGTIRDGDARDKMLCAKPTSDENELYAQAFNWLICYFWVIGNDPCHDMPDPDTVPVMWRPIPLNFYCCHWADGQHDVRGSMRVDGAAYVAYYKRCPIRIMDRLGHQMQERRPVARTHWTGRQKTDCECPAVVSSNKTVRARARPINGLEVVPVGVYVAGNLPMASAQTMPAGADRKAHCDEENGVSSEEEGDGVRRYAQAGRNQRSRNMMMLQGRISMMTNARKKRKRGKTVNIMGKGNYLWDSGSTYNIEQLAKNLPGDVRVAGTGDYNIRTANGDLLTVTHYSFVESVGESVVADIDCRILSAVQLLKTGHTFVGGGNTLVITSPTGVECRGTLTVNDEFIIPKSEVAKLLAAPEWAGTRRGRVRAASDSSADEDEDEESGNTPQNIPGLSERSSSEMEVTAEDLEAEVGTNPEVRDSASKGAYTKQQRERAKQVQLLHEYAHMSNSTLTRALNTGVFAGTALTGRDVDVYKAIYGPCTACIAGKLTAPSYRTPSESAPAERAGQCLWADLWPFEEAVVGGYSNYLISVDEWSDYGSAIPLNLKKSVLVTEGLMAAVSMYSRHGHTVEKIVTDSEATFRKCEAALGLSGIELTHTPPYQHAQRIERYVRTLKDRIRTILASMTYELPAKLYGMLLEAAVEILNRMPSSKHQLATPGMLVSGSKLDLNIQRLIPFGSVGMLHAATRGKGGVRPRADMGIVLGGCRNTPGSYNCWSMHSEKVVRRRNITILPVLPTPFPYTIKPNRTAVSELVLDTNTISSLETERLLDTLDDSEENYHPSTDRGESGAETDSETEPINCDEVPGDVEESAPDRVFVQESVQEVLKEVMPSEGNPGQAETEDTEMTEPDTENVEPEVQGELYFPEVSESVERDSLTMLNTEVNSNPKVGSRGQRTKRPNRQLLDAYAATGNKTMKTFARAYKISMNKALKSDRGEESREAAAEEIKNMLQYKVGHYVAMEEIPHDKRRNIISSFMFLKHKEDAQGNYTRTKARLVGNGANQKSHMYDLVSSATVGLASVFMLLNIATFFVTMLCSFDIKGAFLNAKFGESDEVTYIKLNRAVTKIWLQIDPSAEPYVDSKGELLLELDKFIYGLKQSPRKFQEHLVGTLTALGYRQLEQDECLFIKSDRNGFSLLSVHVDDILQACTSRAMYTELKDGLTDVYGTITASEAAAEYLGMGIDRSRCGRFLKLTQLGLVKKILDKYPVKAGKHCRSPAGDDIFDEKEELGEPVSRTEYMGLVMTLMYIARLTRPDILMVVTYLATRSHCATTRDWKYCMRVVRYLSDNQEIGITMHCTSLQVRIWADASYAAHGDGKGHTGYIIYLGDSYVHARSGKQKLQGTSSTDAEIIAAVEAVKMAVWLREVLREMRISPLDHMILYQDNQSGLTMVSEQSKFKRSKHILTKIMYIRDLVTTGCIVAKHIVTDLMTPDVLTKPKQGDIFELHRKNMMGEMWEHKVGKSAQI